MNGRTVRIVVDLMTDWWESCTIRAALASRAMDLEGKCCTFLSGGTNNASSPPRSFIYPCSCNVVSI